MHGAIIRPSGPDPQETGYAKEQRIFAEMQKADYKRRQAAHDACRRARRPAWPARLFDWLRPA